jgi:hypothetical protein
MPMIKWGKKGRFLRFLEEERKGGRKEGKDDKERKE